jgi:adenosine kinase
MVLESVGTQEYTVEKDDFSTRLAESYGDDCAAEVLPHLS